MKPDLWTEAFLDTMRLAGDPPADAAIDAIFTHGEIAAVNRLMDDYYRAVRGPIEAHGGTVVQLLGDGVMCAFGVPRVAEDDAIRAVRSAVGVQRAFREFVRAHGEVAGKVLEHGGFPGVDIVCPQKAVISRRRRLRLELGREVVAPRAVLLELAARVQLCVGEDGQGAGALAQSVEAGGDVRSPEVLPALRVRHVSGATRNKISDGSLMRVIAGEFRSRRLASVEGLETRPTPDSLRETLFNILGASVEGCVFLDAYAGTGAVGMMTIWKSRLARRKRSGDTKSARNPAPPCCPK